MKVNAMWSQCLRFGLLIGLACGGIVQARGETPGWRESVSCGPNALYVYLRGQGADVSLADVRDLVSVSRKGASFASMADAAATLGVESRIVQTSPEVLKTLPCPCVILYHAKGTQPGHYFVLAESDRQGFRLFDPLTTLTTTVSTAELSREWTGYVLIPSEAPVASGQWLLAGFFGCTLWLGMGLWRRSSLRTS
ncbi:cysteine peptidase family C39 domain-containing protein [Stieleria maiorica]|nr:cysteine peptidase family C39 domain-containing protein [Stieleria maiorica]